MARARLIVGLIAIAFVAPLRAEVAASGSFTAAEGSVRAELRIDRARHATLRLITAATGHVRTLPLVAPEDVLPLLIDRRLTFLWPAIADWAGADLGGLRARLEAESAAAFAQGKTLDRRTRGRFNDGKIAAIADRTETLASTGHNDAAVALLAGKLDGWMPEGDIARQDKAMLLLSLYSVLIGADRTAEAEARLIAFEQQTRGRAEILNILANHALLLAMTGRFAEALALVDRVAATYGSYQKTIGGMVLTIPGSERHAAMIRACALHGLGREDEASAQLALLAGAGKPASLLYEVAANSAYRRRAAMCMGDAARLAEALAEGLGEAPLPADMAVYLNPYVRASIYWPSVLAAAREQPAFVAAARDIVRPRPPELAAASNHWRDGSPSPVSPHRP